jgi:hypothetical protein
VQLLLFADDLVLFAESAAGLQKLLDALADFCKEWQLKINCAKTEVAVFKTDSLAAIGTKALFAFHKRCADLNLNRNVPLQLHMFGALVKPILSYACEV